MGFQRVMGAVCAAVVTALGAAGPSGARPVVVELFTSQGCNACPPADALLGELAARDDVIALALHVDYWDYLGWRDVFGSAANTRRQRSYLRTLGGRTVFTPQLVIDGALALPGARRADVLDEIAIARATPHAAAVALERDPDGMVIRVDGEAQDNPARVLFFVFEPPHVVTPTRGENVGRPLVYHNAVRFWMTLGWWRGGEQVWRAPAPEDARGVAALVQRRDGVIIGAAQRLMNGAAPAVSEVSGAAISAP